MTSHLVLTGVAFTVSSLAFKDETKIGSKGSGDGQFRYVEGFALAKNGEPILDADATHALGTGV